MTMEIRLKERLVGALVLVFAAVIFIPMVLDGPNANRRVSQSVALPDPVETDARRTVRLDLDGAPTNETTPVKSSAQEPVSIDLVPAQEKVAEPVTGTDGPAAKDPEPASQQPAPVREKASVEETASWTVQAGSFSSEDNAEALAAKLRKLDYPAYVSRYNDGARTHYRVRVGGFPSRSAAQTKADEIRTKTGEPAAPVRAR